MKKQFTLLMLATGLFSTVQSQTWSENFTAPFNPVAAGWNIQNLSASANPTLNWFQGAGTVFPAYNGSANDYYAVNYASTTSTVGATISDWLITPSITLVNGGVFEFATRTPTNPADFPDRLEVYASLDGNNTNVGSTPTSLGTFSNLIISINPNLTAFGYPGGWTVYTFTLSGLSSPTAGRIGFRYHVTDGGFFGNNSNYVGLDAVKYTFGCLATVPSYTICSGSSVTIALSGAAANSTYTWNTGPNTSSIVVNPANTTTYEVTYSEPGWQCPAKVSTVTVGSNLSVNLSATSQTLCSGQSATLTASSAASNYSWLPAGQTTSVITITPSVSTVYSVGAWVGFPPTCFGGNTISITVNTTPTVTVASPASPVCTSGSSTTVTFTAGGATTYTWISGSAGITGSLVTLNVFPNATDIFTLMLIGRSNGCSSFTTTSLSIDVQPTVAITSAANTLCIGGTLTLNGTGAETYAWSAGTPSNSSVTVYKAPNTAGTVAINVTGTSSLGCTANAAKVLTVSACGVGVEENAALSNASVFPNPFTNELKISGVEGTVVVYNTLGQQVLTQRLTGTDVINTSELPKGAYVIKAIGLDGETVKTTRVIKN